MKPEKEFIIRDQLSAQLVDQANRIKTDATNQLISDQDGAFQHALEQIDKVRAFLGAPEKILGNPLTKHGEIAEQVEVGIRNARSLIEQEGFVATFEGVGRTAPEDYLLNGIAVQSKFINGASRGLDHVLEHMDKYKSFGRDGSFYQIPKDQHEVIIKVINGDTGELGSKTVRAILSKVNEIESDSGRKFQEVVRPSVINYADSQQGKVLGTLSDEETRLTHRNEQRKENILLENGPSLVEAAQAAAIAGAVSGAIGLTSALYAKHKDGKSLFRGEFTKDDWAEIGIDTSKSAIGGAVAGGSIYLMTNYAGMAAPFAGAVVSAAKGVSALVEDYNSNKIDLDELFNLGTVICAESAMVGIAAIAGQTLIPIPMLGATVGSIAGKMLTELIKEQSEALQAAMELRSKELLSALDEEYKNNLKEIHREFDNIGNIMTAAFSLERNSDLMKYSISLALSLGVSYEAIIKSHDELDDFMMG